jgi:hypothetical protein
LKNINLLIYVVYGKEEKFVDLIVYIIGYAINCPRDDCEG